MRARAALIGVALVAATSSAFADEEVRYKGGPLPPNTHVERKRDDDLVRDAMVAFAGTYIVNTWIAEIGDAVCNGSCKDHSYDLLYVPFVGPAIAAAMPAVQQLSTAWSVILAADSVIQCSAGLVALVAYLLPGKRIIVKDAARARFFVAPTFAGVGVGGVF
jgi:hypothetical protein